MKITAGLGSADEYIRFVEAGADEFFSGFVPYSWTEKYGTVMPLNRREVLCYHVQLGAFSELLCVITNSSYGSSFIDGNRLCPGFN